MNPWADHPVPPMRCEALHGDRVVRCFAGRPTSLLAIFEQSRRDAGSSDAMVFAGQRWSYEALAQASQRLAGSLAAQGLRAGDRVVMLLSNRPEFLTVLLALLRLGVISVPVGVREQRPGLTYIAQQCGARGIVFDAALADRVPLARRSTCADGATERRVT